MFFGARLRLVGIVVVHTYKFDGALPVHFAENSRMLLAERAHAQYSHSDPCCHPRSLAASWPSGEEISPHKLARKSALTSSKGTNRVSLGLIFSDFGSNLEFDHLKWRLRNNNKNYAPC